MFHGQTPSLEAPWNAGFAYSGDLPPRNRDTGEPRRRRWPRWSWAARSWM